MREDASFTSANFSETWDIPEGLSGAILSSGIDKEFNETYYLIDFANRVIHNCRINISNYYGRFQAYFEERMDAEYLPYGQTAFGTMPMNFLQPHEGLYSPRTDQIIVAMHNGPYLRLIDFKDKYVSKYPESDQPVGEMLSATNSIDDEGNYYLAVSALDQRIEKYKGNREEIDTEVFKVDFAAGTSKKLFGMKTLEAIHETKYHGDHILLTEFILTAKAKPPKVRAESNAWDKYYEQGLMASRFYSYSSNNDSLNSIGFSNTPGHIEISKAFENVGYLSCHNLSKALGGLILQGNGDLVKLRFDDEKIEITDTYTDEKFFRVTSHKCIEYGGKNLIVITVYPNFFYIFDEASFEVIAQVELFPWPRIDGSSLYFCPALDHVPIWIESSDDQRYVILMSNKSFYIYDLETKKLSVQNGYSFLNDMMTTAHITNLNDFK